MAGLVGNVDFGAGATTALAAATARTVVEINAPSNQRVQLHMLKISFDGISNSGVPVEVRLGYISTASSSITSATPVKTIPGLPETFNTTVGINATAEPTYSSYIGTFNVHPQYGDTLYFDGDSADRVEIQGGGRLGVVVTAPAAVNARGLIRFEE